MRKYSIAAFVTVSMGCVSACGDGSSTPDGTVGTAGMTGTTAGTAGKGATTGGTKSTGGAGVNGGMDATGGADDDGNAAGMANAGTNSDSGGSAGASTGGTSGTGGAAGSANTGGAVSGGSSGTGGTSGTGTGGTDTGGTTSTGGTDIGGTGGTDTGGTGGSGGSSPGPICAVVDEGFQLSLTCPDTSVVTGIVYASYGTPTGSCGNYMTSNCDSTTSVSEVEAACIGNNSCTVNATNAVFGDPCGGTYKRLYVEATCGNCGNGSVDSGEACDDGMNDGVLCNSDCSAEPEVAQILLHCDGNSEVINSLRGTECIVVAAGGASYINFLSPDVEVTLYSNNDCTGNTKVCLLYTSPSPRD